MQTVEDWLSHLGLGKYVEAFVQNDVDLERFPMSPRPIFKSWASHLGIGRSSWLRSTYLGSRTSTSSRPVHSAPRSRGFLLKRRPNRQLIDGSSACFSVTWLARPLFRHGSTRKTCMS